LQALVDGDYYIVILDVPTSPETDELVRELEALRALVVVNGANKGLSFSRNVAIEKCPTSHLIFTDDDVELTAATIAEIKDACAEGYEIVGVRIDARSTMIFPSYVGIGQLHYLTIHNALTKPTIWGACMSLDVQFVRRHGLYFRNELGRRSHDLTSGEDTSFVDAMKAIGGRDVFLNQSGVIHCFDPLRLRASYIVRRAMWQGRTEWRRGPLFGLKKEWARNVLSQKQSAIQVGFGLVCMIAVVVGISIEALSGWPKRRRVA
jgi:glycosyltransferase involved in cell wall biosynthesis